MFCVFSLKQFSFLAVEPQLSNLPAIWYLIAYREHVAAEPVFSVLPCLSNSPRVQGNIEASYWSALILAWPHCSSHIAIIWMGNKTETIVSTARYEAHYARAAHTSAILVSAFMQEMEGWGVSVNECNNNHGVSNDMQYVSTSYQENLTIQNCLWQCIILFFDFIVFICCICLVAWNDYKPWNNFLFVVQVKLTCLPHCILEILV